MIGGHALGRRAFAALDTRGFEPLLLGVILIAGLASVVSGAAVGLSFGRPGGYR